MTLTQIDERNDSETAAQQIYDAGSITVTKLGENIGAKIDGVRLGGNLADEQIEAIRTALAVNKVVAFTGQDHLDDETQYAFASLLGEPTAPHPTVTSRGDQLLTIEGAANSWHSDVTFVDRIPKASLLRPIVLPTYGGATTWASTVAAYEQLPKPAAFNSYGRIARASGELPAGVDTIVLRAVATPQVRWDFVLETSAGGQVEVIAKLDNQFQLVGMAPWTGISVGLDARGPVDVELRARRGVFRFGPALRAVNYRPGAVRVPAGIRREIDESAEYHAD